MMFSPSRKSHPLLKHMNSFVIDLPTPTNISYMWNFGSLLGLCMMIQIISGILLTMYYSPHTSIAFSSVASITRDVNMGWLLRNLHANGASAFFMSLYLHMARGLYYSSYKNLETWNIGVTMFILAMATAFMGYLLPWGQMSFWGATVITNLFSAIPYFGKHLVEWIWGGFGVGSPTLTRFFALHYILPFVISGLAVLHLIFLHEKGSVNPLGINSNSLKSPFHPYFSSKDILGFMILLMSLMIITMFFPNLLTDPENFLPANPIVTPTHIKPEWYFLWAYAILRSIPNKLGGVVLMFSAILALYLLPMISYSTQQSSQFNISKQMINWIIGCTIILLTWIGGCPVEPPYDYLGLYLTLLYFSSILTPFSMMNMKFTTL